MENFSPFPYKNNLISYQFLGGQFAVAQGASLLWREGVNLSGSAVYY